jgi:O-acetyl-ADP-ribose deacetylase (regulator of RNase III)
MAGNRVRFEDGGEEERDLTRKGAGKSPPIPPTGVTIIIKEGSDLLDTVSSQVEIMQTEGLKRWSQMSPRDFSNSQLNDWHPRVKVHKTPPFPWNEDINSRVALWSGDITALDSHALVHSTNESFSETSSLSSRIHSKAGPQLRLFLQEHIRFCRTGDATVTRGFNLPSRFIIHAVGPKYNEKYQTAAEGALFSTLLRVLTLCRDHHIRSLSLPPVNSVKRGFPSHDGAHMTLRVVRRFLEKYLNDFDLIVFGVEDPLDLGIYDHLMPLYFPRSDQEQEYSCYYLPEDVGGADGQPVIPERQIRIADKPLITRSASSTSYESNGEGHLFDDDATVDLSSGLESSVLVGKTLFAQMQPDIDRRWTTSPAKSNKVKRESIRSAILFNTDDSSRRREERRGTNGSNKHKKAGNIVYRVASNDSEDCDPIVREIKRRSRYERIVRNAKRSDFKDMDRLRFLYHCGEDRYGRDVIVIIGNRLPFGSISQESLLSYFIRTLHDIITSRRSFIVVYTHSLTSRVNHPGMSFLKTAAETLDPRSWSQFSALYVVHSSLWTRVLFWYFGTFVSSTTASGLKDKVSFVPSVKALSHLIPIEQLQIPAVIMNHDSKA